MNADHTELASLSEDPDNKDFDVPKIVKDNSGNALLGEVLQQEKKINDAKSSTDEEPSPPIK